MGMGLTPLERATLDNALILLQKDYKSKVEFWGKVLCSGEGAGTTHDPLSSNDYLVCTICQGGAGQHRLHVYSMDTGLTWNLLDPLTASQEVQCSCLRGNFTGNPRYLCTGMMDDDVIEAGNKICLTEATRLAYLIKNVDEVCQVLPRDLDLGGISLEAALRTDNYYHTSPDQRAISSDIPHGVWVLKQDAISNEVVGHNLLYQGYRFIYAPNTTNFKQEYIGNGQRNDDLVFTL